MLYGGPRCRHALVVTLALSVLAPSFGYEYCAAHPQRPCWGVRKTLSEAGPGDAFPDINVGSFSSTKAVDWDGDGHLDLLVGARDGTVRFYPDGHFLPHTSTANPFADIDAGDIATPEAVDWNGDGRLDLLVGMSDGTVRFYRGSADGSLLLQTGAANPFTDVRVGSRATPKAVDWDGDGSLDLLVGDIGTTVRFYRGSLDGNLLLQTGAANPFGDIDVGEGTAPEAVDWDGDGRLDLLVGTKDGTVHFYRGSASGNLLLQTSTANPFADINVGGYATPEAVDWDGDGRLDLLVGSTSGSVRFFWGGVDESLSQRLGAADPLAGVIVPGMSATPKAVDWDGDGHLDLLVGARDGTVHFYGGAADGSLSQQLGAANPFNDIDVPKSAPEAVDWDGDGRLDLLLGASDGTVRFYRGGVHGDLAQQLGAANPFAAIDVGGEATPNAVDWDGDGHLDLVVGASDGSVGFYRGGADGSLVRQLGTANPFAGIDVLDRAVPQAVDWDGDGFLDLLLGLHDGSVLFYRGSADGNLSQPNDTANPFKDVRVGQYSAPRAVDWDGDGYLELLLGDNDGRVHFFSAHCDRTAAAEVCSYAGFCRQHTFGRCECATSNDNPGASDCSACADFFFHKGGTVSLCQPCPGEGTSKGPCSRRGTCWDSKAARQAQGNGTWAPTQAQAPANGTCACEFPFSGDDCGQGDCPEGTELTLTDTHFKRSGQYPIWETCTACAVGQYKPTPGNTPCNPCTPGQFQSTSGATLCDQCPQGKKQPLSGSFSCEDCGAGTAPTSDQTACEECSAGRHASPGQQSCSACPTGFVPADDRSDCQPCTAGSVPSDDHSHCRACPVLFTSSVGSSTCSVQPAVWVTTGGTLGTVLGVCLWLTLRCRARRTLARTMQGGSADKLREALQWGSLMWLGAADIQPARRQLRVLQKKYVDYEYLLKIVEEGDLQLIKGSWLANKHNCRRLMWKQDLPPEAVWTVDDLRGSLHAVLFVAVSCCWLHEVHPDPSGTHLRTLRHAIRLRLGLRGPGQIVDIALFFDYCSLAQHGERGDPLCPVRGDVRPPAEQASFGRGLRHVNIPYANQSVEVWKMQYTPDNEKRTYMERGWPYFEQAVSALIKDAAHLLLILPESQKCQNWLELHEAALAGRMPPLTPAQFNGNIERKTFTSPGTDKALVIRKYEETFHDVLGHATILWFTDLGWGDEEAAQLAQVLPFCRSLLHLYLGSNRITEEGAAALAAAAGGCPVRSMDLLGNPIASTAEAQLRRQWQRSGKAPDLLRMDDETVEILRV